MYIGSAILLDVCVYVGGGGGGTSMCECERRNNISKSSGSVSTVHCILCL